MAFHHICKMVPKLCVEIKVNSHFVTLAQPAGGTGFLTSYVPFVGTLFVLCYREVSALAQLAHHRSFYLFRYETHETIG